MSNASNVQENQMDMMLQKTLLEIGITPNLYGYQYIIDAVKLLIVDKARYSYVTKELYPEIAAMHSTTMARAERCIRHAITKSINADHGEMEEALGISPYRIKMTNSEFIHLLLRKVTSDEKIIIETKGGAI